MRRPPLPLLAAATLAASAAPAHAGMTLVSDAGRPSDRPQILVDDRGGTLLAWETSDPHHRIRIAYRPAGRAFRRAVLLPLPPGAQDARHPTALHVRGGELRLAFAALRTSDGAEHEYIARSADRAATWRVDALPLAASPADPPTYAFPQTASAIVDATGIHGLASYGAGISYVHVAPDLSSATSTLIVGPTGIWPSIARSADGSIFSVGTDMRRDGRIEVMGPTGALTVTLPCADQIRPDVVGGPHGVVLLASGCGRAWTTTISSTGAVGRIRRLAPMLSGLPPLGIRRTAHGYIAAFAGADGDIRIARSTDGERFRVQAGVIPSAIYEPGTTLEGSVDPSGAITWRRGYRVPESIWYATPGYRVGPPRIVTRGMLRPRVVRLGTTALAVPGTASLAALRRAPLRLRAAVTARDLQAFVRVTARRRAGGGQVYVTAVATPLRRGATRRLAIPIPVALLSAQGVGAGGRLVVELGTRNGPITVAIRLVR